MIGSGIVLSVTVLGCFRLQSLDFRLMCLVFIFVWGFGFVYAKYAERGLRYPTDYHSEHLVSVDVASQVKFSTRKKTFEAVIRSTGDRILVSMSTRSATCNPSYGDRLSVVGRFFKPDQIRNPGQFDYGRYLRIRGIRARFRADQCQVVGIGFKNPFRLVAHGLKSKITAINRQTLPYPYSDLNIGLVFGDYGTNMPDEMTARFQKTGLIHLLVVSGSQVSLLSGVMFGVLRFVPVSPQIRFALLTVVNIVFYFLTGGGASIFRAVLMNELALGLSVLYRNVSFYHIFSVTALIMLLINPMYLFDMGFILSFLATLSLVWGVPRVEELCLVWFPIWISRLIALAMAPFLFTFPVLWVFFRSISPISILSNMIVINWIEILVVVGFFSTLIGFVALPITAIINQFSWLLMVALDAIVMRLSTVPFAVLNVVSPGAWVLLPLYGLLVFFLDPVLRRSRLGRGAVWGVSLAMLVWIGTALVVPKSEMTVTFFDVGQGDAALIETPDGKVALIDSGGIFRDWRTGDVLFDAGRSVILPALRHKGINKIDLLVTTHYHLDHMGGSESLFSTIPVGIYMDSGVASKSRPKFVSELAHQLDTDVVRAVRGMSLPLGQDVTVRILYPAQHSDVSENENNNSVVLKVSMGEIDVLFTGDLEFEKEHELVDEIVDELESEVLQLGHHGSRTSSTLEFLDRVRPKIGVASLGRRNRYGHPSDEVMDRLARRDIQVFRTDRHGAVEMTTDGRRMSVRTWL